MITLQDLIISVKEKNLSKDELEAYRDQLSNLYAEMQIEMAELEKTEAEYMADPLFEELSVAERKVQWKGRPSGMRLIVLKRYCLATKELLNSLKSRLYSIY
jgi:hypothetical protein